MMKKLFTVTAILLTSLTVVSSPANAADDCGITKKRFKDGATVGVCQTAKELPPADTNAPYKEPTDEERWNRYCSRLMAGYEPGKKVRLKRVSGDDSEASNHLTDPTKEYIKVECDSDGNGIAALTRYEEAGSVSVSSVDPVVVRDEVFAKITVPEPIVESSPKFGNPDIPGIVNYPTWFWVNNPWDPITVTDSQGGLSVSVTAAPSTVSWDPGDGNDPIICAGPGQVWNPNINKKAVSSYCQHIYTSSSADQPDMQYELSATMNWVFTWSLNGVEQGEFHRVQTSTGFVYQVGEIQAIEVS